MKKKSLFKICLFSLAALCSCDGKLDIKPEDTLVETDVFAEEALAERALGEAYLKLATSSTGAAFTLAEFTTNITKTEDSEYYIKFIDGNLRPEDETISDIWLNYYATINLANGLITNIPIYGAYNEDIEAQHIGEAKFIRAWAYFKLLCLFGEGALTQNMNGMGLPLQLTAFSGYNEEDKILPRSSVQDIYNQIINDLDESAATVPLSYGTSSGAQIDTRSRATKGGAYALLSRVYLYMGDYDHAAQYAKMVIDLNDIYELTDEITDLFPNNSESTPGNMNKEYIFGFPYSGDQMGANNIAFSYYYKLSLWADTLFLKNYIPGDLRLDELIYAGDTEYNKQIVAGRTTTRKFSNVNGRDNVPVIRVAEVMLTRAEALARNNGINQESIDLLNAIFTRSNPSATGYVTGDFANTEDLIARIVHERSLELAFEGHQRYDLIRTGRPLRNANLTPDQMVFPIPQTDINISNGVIKQNPGY